MPSSSSTVNEQMHDEIELTAFSASRDESAHKEERQRPDMPHGFTMLSVDYSSLRLPSMYTRPSSFLHWLLITACLILSAYVLNSIASPSTTLSRHHDAPSLRILQPSVSSNNNHKKKHDPEKWLREHSNLNHFETGKELFNDRPKAAIISLVRNEELDGILQSMKQLEWHWNKRYNYPWMFFSEQSFTDEFKSATTNATSAQTSYHLIPPSHWKPATHISPTRFHSSLSYLGTLGVGKGYLLSYRNMCRWNSGFFYQHPALSSYSYYWRVEPDVHFFCDIPYDPFRFLRDNGIVYGFNMNILDDARSFASLWKRTREFMRLRPELVSEDADLSWLVDEGGNGGEYNDCQFFSNFEIGSLDFFRGEANSAYFEYLDSPEVGGFYYERFGDAPVHTLSVAMFAGGKDKMWYFRDIGYQHDIARHCPRPEVRRGMCDCEATGLDENFYKLVPMESPQRKPGDSCLRLWLGGEWLERREGYEAEVERALGGDGLSGYVRKEFE
ncbi:hypothetical protein PMZ80_001228 [Knufia obscura]|uniref:Uncharacterized protein n=1 Tax=Knufia obscura TaxID=1635080 RepID=A0ABR0S2H6_9EURO|nr:hypothetical protein PMZ80_001228 [Knufia obscura]